MKTKIWSTLKIIWDFICMMVKFVLKSILPIGSFYLAIHFAFMDKPAQMSAFIAACFLFIFMFFAKELGTFFESISIAGLCIKLRETIDEAEKTIDKAKEITEMMAESILYLIKTKDGWGSEGPEGTDKEKEFYEKIEETLLQVGIEKNKVKEIQKENWHNYVYKNYIGEILNLSYNLHPEERKKLNTWYKENNKPLLSPEELKEKITDYNAELTEDENESLNKYSNYYKKYNRN